MMFSDDEKRVLKDLVEKELESISKENKSIVYAEHPNFLSAEQKYSDFLRELIKKL